MVGVPGQRTFRLLVKNRTMSAQLWLEKEELDALTKAIARMLLEIDTDGASRFPNVKQLWKIPSRRTSLRALTLKCRSARSASHTMLPVNWLCLKLMHAAPRTATSSDSAARRVAIR